MHSINSSCILIEISPYVSYSLLFMEQVLFYYLIRLYFNVTIIILNGMQTINLQQRIIHKAKHKHPWRNQDLKFECERLTLTQLVHRTVHFSLDWDYIKNMEVKSIEMFGTTKLETRTCIAGHYYRITNAFNINGVVPLLFSKIIISCQALALQLFKTVFSLFTIFILRLTPFLLSFIHSLVSLPSSNYLSNGNRNQLNCHEGIVIPSENSVG